MDDINKLAVRTALLLSLSITAVGLYFYYPTLERTVVPPTTTNVVVEDSNTQGGTGNGTNSTASSVAPAEGWINYTSPQGISFYYPKETLGTDCNGKANALVPIRTFEDPENKYLYLTINCTDTLETLRTKTKQALIGNGNYKQDKLPDTWSIATKAVKTDDELNAFISEHYGTGGCIAGTKKPTGKQDGVYEITVSGKDWKNPTDGFSASQSCKVDYAYKIFYAPAKNKVVSLVLGQDCTFNRSDKLEDCYGEEDKIVGSIIFN